MIIVYLNPENMPVETVNRVDRWMVANGCHDYIAMAPITVTGKTAYYWSLGRRNAHIPSRRWSRTYLKGDDIYPKLRRLRIRIPYWKVA